VTQPPPGPALAGLTAADDPVAWERAGFTVSGGAVQIGSVTVGLAGCGAGKGLVGWTLRGHHGGGDIDGVPTSVAPDVAPRPSPAHPNGATRLDHVVVLTPDLERTFAALTGAGLQLRRVRDAGTPERPTRQGFFWAGDVILEVGGPREPAGDGPAALWGLVAVVADHEATAALLGDHLGAFRDAVQAGRHIATVQRSCGVTVPLALITPHER
jgi:hypothetical protein